VSKVVTEVGSGVNDHCPKFLALLTEDQYVATIVVAQKDQATHCGFHYVEALLQGQRRTREVVILAENTREGADLVADLGAVMYSYCARWNGWYGQRRAKRQTATNIAQLEHDEQKRPEAR
jgi:putative resolvase